MEDVVRLIKQAIEAGENGNLSEAKVRLEQAVEKAQAASAASSRDGVFHYLAYVDLQESEHEGRNPYFARVAALYLYNSKAELQGALGKLATESGGNLQELCSQTQNYAWGQVAPPSETPRSS